MNDALTGYNTVAALLAARAAATPQAPAFQVETTPGHWEPINWQDFAGRALRLAGALQAAGLRKGDRLAIIAPVSLEWELLHHAALSCGVVVVGLDAHDLPERIAATANKADIVAFAATGPHLVAQLGGERLAACRLLLQLGASGEAPAGPGWMNWAGFEALGSAASAGPAPEAPAGGDTATIIFTSGTTGEPKGIAYSHAQVCLAIDAIGAAYGFVGPGSRLLCWLPLSNLFQRMVNLAGMRNGAATYLLSDPRRVMDVVATVSPDIFVGVPRFYEKLYEGIRNKIAALPPLRRRLAEWAWEIGRRTSRDRLAGRKVTPRLAAAHLVAERLVLKRVRGVMGDRLRCMVTGSAPTPLHLQEEFHALGWLVLEAYGMSENVVPMAMNRIDAYCLGTVGRPLAGNEIRLGDDGTVFVRGPGVFEGYWGEANTSTRDVDGFFATGDVGAFDADGFLSLTGRNSELIKTSTGRRIAPAAVEAQLRLVPGIDQALLVGTGRKYAVALCTCVDPTLTEAARTRILLDLREQIALISHHERPQGVALIRRPFSVDLGELTPNLKLKRWAIEDHYACLIERLYNVVEEQVSSGVQKVSII